MATAGLVRSLGAGIAGFLAYGAWAFWVNMDHSMATGIRAGLVQGTYSLVLTFCTTYLMEFLLGRLRSTGHEVILTIVITMGLLFGVAWTINWLARIPEILMTILPGFVIGSVYTVVYVTAVARKVVPGQQITVEPVTLGGSGRHRSKDGSRTMKDSPDERD